MQVSEKSFYERQYQADDYAQGVENREETSSLQAFVAQYNLRDKRVLEVGCGRGAFQWVVSDWVGMDLAVSVQRHIHRPFVVASATALPFKHRSFDGAWSITVLEHVPDPEKALEEIARVLKPGGSAYLAPAWHCRLWAAKGYHVRPWHHLDWKGRFAKAIIPLRNTLVFRAAHTLPIRIWRELLFLFGGKRPMHLWYRALQANLETYWCADSDACNWMDPHEMLLWFRGRRWETPSHPNWLSRFLVRHGRIVVQKPDTAETSMDGKVIKRMSLLPKPFRLAVIASHPIQYHVPLYRALAARPEIDLTVHFCSDWGANEYIDPGFGTRLKWDIPLLDGYQYRFLTNWSPWKRADRFWGVINPSIVRELRIDQFDAIIVQGYALATYWLGFLGAWLSNTPVFFRGETVLRGDRPWWIRVGKHVLLKLLFQGTAAFLTIGSRSRQFYKAFDVSDDRLFFTPYTIDNAFFMENSIQWSSQKSTLKASLGLEDLPVILFVGKLIGRKRPGDLLRAYETIQKDASLVFVGDGVLRRELEAQAKECGLDRVLFVGLKNQSELPKYYAIGDIFVLPSSYEVSPLVINEAMCCGLPIVVSDAVPSAVDFVRNGENGYIYPCSDVVRLRAILDELLDNKDMLHSMGVRSRETIEHWSVPKAVEGILEALRNHGRRSAAQCLQG